jgi:hypothetical protein
MAEWVIGLIRKAQGEQGVAQLLGGSNVSELADEAERAKGLSSLLTGASAQGEGTPDAKSWGTRRLFGMACVLFFKSFSLTFLQYPTCYNPFSLKGISCLKTS